MNILPLKKNEIKIFLVRNFVLHIFSQIINIYFWILLMEHTAVQNITKMHWKR